MESKTDSAGVSVAAPPSHTKGPWTHYDDSDPKRYHPQHKIQSRGKSIATIYCTRGDEAADLANARLIAAAPDLLEALTALLKAVEAEEAFYGDGSSCPASKKAAYAAITKATDSAATPAPDAK